MATGRDDLEKAVDAGVSDTAVHRRTRVELPGYYRAQKKWDLVVVVDGRLFATDDMAYSQSRARS